MDGISSPSQSNDGLRSRRRGALAVLLVCVPSNGDQETRTGAQVGDELSHVVGGGE